MVEVRGEASGALLVNITLVVHLLECSVINNLQMAPYFSSFLCFYHVSFSENQFYCTLAPGP